MALPLAQERETATAPPIEGASAVQSQPIEVSVALATIAGMVVDESGAGVAGARVHFLCGDVANSDGNLLRATKTNAEGRYSKALRPGSWSVGARGPKEDAPLVVYRDTVACSPGEVHVLDLLLSSQSRSIRGRIRHVDPDVGLEIHVVEGWAGGRTVSRGDLHSEITPRVSSSDTQLPAPLIATGLDAGLYNVRIYGDVEKTLSWQTRIDLVAGDADLGMIELEWSDFE